VEGNRQGWINHKADKAKVASEEKGAEKGGKKMCKKGPSKVHNEVEIRKRGLIHAKYTLKAIGS